VTGIAVAVVPATAPAVVSNRGLETSSSHENFVATVRFLPAARENTASG
jgi:hypothetical protein